MKCLRASSISFSSSALRSYDHSFSPSTKSLPSQTRGESSLAGNPSGRGALGREGYHSIDKLVYSDKAGKHVGTYVLLQAPSSPGPPLRFVRMVDDIRPTRGRDFLTNICARHAERVAEFLSDFRDSSGRHVEVSVHCGAYPSYIRAGVEPESANCGRLILTTYGVRWRRTSSH